MSVSNKKVLAEQLKAKLNSPEYVEMPDLITHDDRYTDMLTWFGKKGWISGTNINPGKGNKHKSKHTVSCEELEKSDWEEIASLVEKRREEKEQLYDQKRAQILKKLNNTPNLYYRFANNKRISISYFVYPDKHGEYFSILGVENGREYYLNINVNHPVLTNFPWQKIGYYLIETNKRIERNDEAGRPWSDGGEDNPNNFHKWVEVGDQITITPYETVDKSIDYPKENEDFTLLKEKSANEANKEVINWLLKYFQENNIKEIAFKNNELVITNNNNEIVASSEQKENQVIKRYLQESNKQSLNKRDLSSFLDNESIPTNPKNNMPLLIGGGMLVVGLIIGLLLNRKRQR